MVIILEWTGGLDTTLISDNLAAPIKHIANSHICARYTWKTLRILFSNTVNNLSKLRHEVINSATTTWNKENKTLSDARFYCNDKNLNKFHKIIHIWTESCIKY
jgi:hypothetical protein